MAVYLKISAVKQSVKSKDKRCSMDFIKALDREVGMLIENSIKECKTMTLKELLK